jgi:heat shock protein HtpX
MKRILLFVLTNVLVVAVLGIVASLLGVNRFRTANGLNLGALLGFALAMALRRRHHLAVDQQADGQMDVGRARHRPAAERRPGLDRRDGAQICRQGRHWHARSRASSKATRNAFATGAFKNSALVAVSTGLLQGMTREEVEAVIGHEVAHIANGDMVTMTLIQGVMNTFVVFLSRVIGYAVDSFLRKGDDRDSGPGIGYMVTTIVL